MLDPATMTNAQIVKEYDRNQRRSLEITHTMIADGFGHVTPSMERDNPDIHPLSREDLKLMDRSRQLHVEADRRYGPGLIIMAHLTHGRGSKSYRRMA